MFPIINKSSLRWLRVTHGCLLVVSLCFLQGTKSDEPCAGRDCSGGCKCHPEKGSRVSHVVIFTALAERNPSNPLAVSLAMNH
uniref:Secreted protein n=1 Tax=Scophthalmus maximus TaxID=52904 RepID=A0A8D3DKU0_SCOMX